jgi:hypothetical protein
MQPTITSDIPSSSIPKYYDRFEQRRQENIKKIAEREAKNSKDKQITKSKVYKQKIQPQQTAQFFTITTDTSNMSTISSLSSDEEFDTQSNHDTQTSTIDFENLQLNQMRNIYLLKNEQTNNQITFSYQQSRNNKIRTQKSLTQEDLDFINGVTTRYIKTHQTIQSKSVQQAPKTSPTDIAYNFSPNSRK